MSRRSTIAGWAQTGLVLAALAAFVYLLLAVFIPWLFGGAR